MSKQRKARICIVSGIPSVLTGFYGDLLGRIIKEDMTLCIISSTNKKLTNLCSAIKCQLFPVEISRQITPFRDFLVFIKIFMFFLKNRFDIVHMHTPKGAIIGLLASFLSCHPVRIYTIHGLPMETASGLTRRILWLSEKLCCLCSTHIYAVSKSLRIKIIKEKLCLPKKISILEHGTACGIDIKRFTPNDQTTQAGLQIRHKYGMPEHSMVIGYMGRLTPEKGIGVLIKSFLELEILYKDLYLLLVGYIDSVREIIEKNIIDIIHDHPRIMHVGYQEDVVPYYAAMNLYVMPTLREGFGMTFIEAGAMKLPVVGTRTTGCVDAVSDGETGFLVDINDQKGLTKIIMRLLIDSELRRQIGENGRKRAIEYFGSERLIQAHLELYKKLS